jgi:hypothetical protein
MLPGSGPVSGIAVSDRMLLRPRITRSCTSIAFRLPEELFERALRSAASASIGFVRQNESLSAHETLRDPVVNAVLRRRPWVWRPMSPGPPKRNVSEMTLYQVTACGAGLP